MRGWGVLIVGLAAVSCSGQELYRGVERPAKVQQRDVTWHDEARKRDVPVRIYTPEGTDGKRPLVVFSHGLGGSRRGYSYLGEHLAGQGYLVVVPTHEGSDTAGVGRRIGARVRRRASGDESSNGVVRESTDEPANLKNRPRDISFVLDSVAKDPELSKLVDMERIGVGGHSFGAYTALAIGGMVVDLPDAKDQSFRDRRVKAVLPMSPQGAGVMGVDARAWEGVSAPVLFLTGTKDYGQGERIASWRREAFDAITGVDEFLVTLDGGTHMTFADGDRLNPQHKHHVELIEALATAWFDAELKGDAAARTWLEAFAIAMHGDCVAEHKPARKADGK